MINIKSAFTLFIVLTLCAVQIPEARARIFMDNDIWSADLVEANPMTDTLTISEFYQKTKTTTEVEPQPWGLGIAVFFTFFGVLVMKIRTPRPTFFFVE